MASVACGAHPGPPPDAGYNLGYRGHSCPAPPRGCAGRYHGHLQGHRGARQSSPCSPHLTGSPRQKGRWAPLGGRGCQALGLPVLSQSRSGRRRSSAAAGGADLALPSGVGPLGQHPVPLSSAPRVLASQDGAASVLGSFCPLGSRVLRPAPLAVVAVHSLPQVRPSARFCLAPSCGCHSARRGKGLEVGPRAQLCSAPALGLGPEADDPAPHLYPQGLRTL